MYSGGGVVAGIPRVYQSCERLLLLWQVVHISTVTWLAKWKDSVNGEDKQASTAAAAAAAAAVAAAGDSLIAAS